MSKTIIEIIDESPTIEISDASPTIETHIVSKGDKGDPGSKGVGLDYVWDGTKLGIKTTEEEHYNFTDLAASSYVHDQIMALKDWHIVHNLNRKPNVVVVDSGESVVLGSIIYISDNELLIQFTAEFAGKAYLS